MLAIGVMRIVLAITQCTNHELANNSWNLPKDPFTEDIVVEPKVNSISEIRVGEGFIGAKVNLSHLQGGPLVSIVEVCRNKWRRVVKSRGGGQRCLCRPGFGSI